MDKEKVIRLINEFIANIKSVYDLRKVVLYGSWLNGVPHEDSDIDVAIVMHKSNHDYLDVLTKLYDLASKVDVRIEPVLFEEEHDASGFLKQILNEGEIIYDQDLAEAVS